MKIKTLITSEILVIIYDSYNSHIYTHTHTCKHTHAHTQLIQLQNFDTRKTLLLITLM